MSFQVFEEGYSIVKCTNPMCQGSFSVVAYTFSDNKCTKISAAKIIPLTGNTNFYCPCCGTNLKDSANA